MRTLAKPPKTKKIEKTQAPKKPTSKKISKTTFIDPFHYKIQTLQHQDSDVLQGLLQPYFQQLRQKMPFKQSTKRKQFISFTNKKQSPVPLVSNQVIFGCKQVLKVVKKINEQIKMVVVFYEQNRYDILEQLFCLISKKSIPLIIARSNTKLNEKLGFKSITCIGLKNQEISHRLSKLCGKCSVEIPWLVEPKWMPLKEQ